MIMPRGQPLLLPVNPVFIGVSLIAALAINMLPLGHVAWRPDFVLLLLAFWGVHQPRRVGMGVAFVMGLCMDVQQSALLGQHALMYVVALFCASAMHRRLLWFRAPSQALQIFPVLVLAHGLEWVLRMATGGVFPGVWMFFAPVAEALLWPIISWVLLAPQRQPLDRDGNRPL